jgi:hypothetical protein
MWLLITAGIVSDSFGHSRHFSPWSFNIRNRCIRALDTHWDNPSLSMTGSGWTALDMLSIWEQQNIINRNSGQFSQRIEWNVYSDHLLAPRTIPSLALPESRRKRSPFK